MQKASFPLASPGGVCNDLAMDAKGNLYVTDSFFGIERLPAGGAALEVWKNDPLFTAGQGQFAVDGLVIDGSDLYANNLTTGALVRVPIAADGTAQAPVAITIKSTTGAAVTLAAPDGMRLRSAHTLLVAESGADAIGEVKIDPATNTAVRETFASRIDRPSSLALSGGAAWVAEGQIARLFGLEATAVNYPFYVSRIPLH
jgi:sugar lactone lactonase YvrE